jgi:hypothetical protein
MGPGSCMHIKLFETRRGGKSTDPVSFLEPFAGCLASEATILDVGSGSGGCVYIAGFSDSGPFTTSFQGSP